MFFVFVRDQRYRFRACHGPATENVRRESRLDRTSVVDQMRGILVEQLGVEAEEVKEEASFQEDLNADSLDLVELIMEMEDRFDLKIPDEEAEKIATVGNAVDYILANASS